MRVALLAVEVVFLSSRVLCASTVHVIETEHIPNLMASSDLVCKGEVVEAPEVVFSTTLVLPELPRRLYEGALDLPGVRSALVQKIFHRLVAPERPNLTSLK